jgi:hypothetical protein
MRAPVRHLFLALVFTAASLSARGELIDRIAATVGRQVITDSQIAEEIAVAAFLDAKPPDWSERNRDQTANRLIDQTLIRREIEATRFPQATAAEGAHLLDQLRAATPGDFQAALKSAHLTEAILAQHFEWQVTFLRFVEYRFRPGIQIPEGDLRDFYEKQVAVWRQQNKPIPSLEDSRPDLERLLGSRYVDQALDRWLGDQRTQTQIVFKRSAKP